MLFLKKKIIIVCEEILFFWAILMATKKQQTTNYKWFCALAFLVFLALLARRWYLWFSDINLQKSIKSTQDEIADKQVILASFSDKPGFDKLKYVENLERNYNMMPRSDHVHAIMAIFDDLLAVDNSDTFNIAFSNFEISLENVRLDWYVTNLRLLYQWVNGSSGLIEKFEELDFLDNISIRTYEKSSDELWYNFTLTANVINNGK